MTQKAVRLMQLGNGANPGKYRIIYTKVGDDPKEENVNLGNGGESDSTGQRERERERTRS